MSQFKDCWPLTESMDSEVLDLLVVHYVTVVNATHYVPFIMSLVGGDMLFPLRKQLHMHKMHPLEIPLTKVSNH